MIQRSHMCNFNRNTDITHLATGTSLNMAKHASTKHYHPKSCARLRTKLSTIASDDRRIRQLSTANILNGAEVTALGADKHCLMNGLLYIKY